MSKEVFLSVGELGWDLYLSAHLRWLKEQGKLADAVMTLEGRKCLYRGLADKISTIPSGLIRKFNFTEQECFGFYGVPAYEVIKYLNPLLPQGYSISTTQPLHILNYREIYPGQMIFKPYLYKTKLEGRPEILVFPRRRGGIFKMRNLPKEFYMKLIERLCDKFKDYIIRTMGTPMGAYNITEVKKPNYINFIGKTPTIQALIDQFQLAVGAVGSQSFPPKLALLQGIPTFMVGHSKIRHTEDENWMKTRVGFCEISPWDYKTFNGDKCIDEIVEFFKEEK